MDDQSRPRFTTKEVLTSSVSTKIELMKSRADMLRELLNKADMEIAAMGVLKTEEQDLNKIKEMDSKLGSALETLCGTSTEDAHDQASVPVVAVSRTKSSKSSSKSDVTKLIKRIEALETAMFEKQVAEADDTVKQQLYSMDDKLQNLSNAKVHAEKKLSSKLRRLEVKLKEVKTNNSIQENKLDSLEEQLQEMTARNTDIVGLLQQTTQGFTTQLTLLVDKDCQTNKSLQDLSSKVAATESSVKTLVSNRKKDDNKLKELEDIVLLAETNRNSDRDYLQKKIEETDSMYKQVCQMVAAQLKPLRHLQDTLNKNHMMMGQREDLSSQLDTVTTRINDLLPRVSSLESRGEQGPAGFTAYFPGVKKMTACSVIKDFTDVRCNEGNCYHPASGIFTAPQDGLYYTSVTLRQRKEGKVDVNVLWHRPGSSDVQKIVCKSATHTDKKSSCGVGLVKMKAGELLFARAVSVIPEASLSQYSSFTCFLIG